MKRLCFPLLILLTLAVAALLYTFVIKGQTTAGSEHDPRTALVLEESERALVLTEMRAFLAALQQITLAATKDDMNGVAAAARKVGRAAQGEVPVSLMKKLPAGFKKLGFATHQAFDQLALDAESLGDREQVLEAMGTLMGNCVGCHAAYQITTAKSP